MPESENIDNSMTRLLVEAGDILRALKPSTVASFLFLVDDTEYTQAEIGDKIGYSGATVSESYRSLEALPLPLVTKHGRSYRVTSAGEALIGHLDGMADRLDVDLQSLDWESEAAHEQVSALLTPLCDSRISIPFFALHSIATRSVIGDRIDRLSSPQQVWIGDVVRDVTDRQQERGESSTSAQIQQVIRRFEKKDAIEEKSDQITLTEKGQEHAVLLERVVQLLEERIESSERNESGKETMTGGGTSRPESQDTEQSTSSERKRESESLTQQIQPHGFLGERSSVENRGISCERPTAVPVYCLQPDAEEADSTSPSREQSSPILPFTPQSVEELIDHAQELGKDYDMDTQLKPCWMVRTESGFYPVESVDDQSSDSL